MIQNSAARLVFRNKRSDHVTPLLYQLHWLPVNYRIQFKILLLVYKAVNGQAPSYISELLYPVNRQRVLRSNSRVLFVVPKTKLVSAGDRAFCSVAPRLWNNLPQHIQHATSVQSFKVLLKTFMFKKAFYYITSSL